MADAIEARRRQLGDGLLVLTHHYQRDEIVRDADFEGDSLRLSMRAEAASRERNVKWIVFCGVSFMAETADVLTDERISVILPNRVGECPMAVRMLGRGAPMCGAMLHVAPQDLLWSLDVLAEGRIVKQVRVPQQARAGARLALERMLRISE